MCISSFNSHCLCGICLAPFRVSLAGAMLFVSGEGAEKSSSCMGKAGAPLEHLGPVTWSQGREAFLGINPVFVGGAWTIARLGPVRRRGDVLRFFR